MKGLVFRVFIGMVEDKYGYDVVDKIIEDSNLASKGIYTSVGTYPHSELFTMAKNLSLEKKISIENLLNEFGKHAFKAFVKSYPVFFENKTNSFELLNEIEDKIHVEVLKLYPEAELPTFRMGNVNANEMQMTYNSQRKMSDFAEGLILGCLEHFGEKAKIDKKKLSPDGSTVLFTITKLHE